MKKLLLFGFCLLVAARSSFAQTDSVKKNAIVKAEEQKSMNRQQILTTGFQAIGKSLTSDDKGLELRTSIFSLFFQDTVKKFRSDNYLKQSFWRNTNFILGGGIDKSSKINAFSIGVSYNLLNLRDPSEVSLKTELSGNAGYQARSKQLEDALIKVNNKYTVQSNQFLADKLAAFGVYANRAKDTTGLWEKVIKLLPEALVEKTWKEPIFQDKYKKYGEILYRYRLDKGGFDVGKFTSDEELDFFRFHDFLTGYVFANQMSQALKTFSIEASKAKGNLKNVNKNVRDAEYNALITAFNKEIAADSIQKIKTAAEAYRKLQEDYDQQVRKIIQRPLLVLGYVYKYNSFGVFHQHVPSLTFLQGLNGGAKKAWDLTLTLSDTIGTNLKDHRGGLGRQVGSIELASSWSLFKGSDEVSLLEMKISAEETVVVAGRFLEEKRNQFFGGLTFQGRLSSKSPWLKFAVKYNKDAKFLGFLDITLNLEKAK